MFSLSCFSDHLVKFTGTFSEKSVFTTDSSGDGFIVEWETDDNPPEVTTRSIMKKKLPLATSNSTLCDKQIQTSKSIIRKQF